MIGRNAAPELRHPGMVSLAGLLPKLEAARHGNKKIVFTNGCYDILHPGHVDLLERCKKLGGVLVLGLNSDASVRRQNKGPERPINPYPARAFVLAHLRAVDFVVEFDDDTPLELIRAVKPDVLVKGGDWPVKDIVGAEFVFANGGQVLSLPLLGDFSTTALVRKLGAAQAGGSQRF